MKKYFLFFQTFFKNVCLLHVNMYDPVELGHICF